MITRRLLLLATTLLTGCSTVSGLPRMGDSSEGAPPDAGDMPSNLDPEIQKVVWKSYYAGTRVWGYVDKHSVSPGEPFNIMMSTRPGIPKATGKIEIFRIGHYSDGDRKLVWEGEDVEISQEEVQMTAASLGADWPMVVDNVETDDWTSGYYTIDFIDGLDGQRELNVAFIVVTNPQKSGDIVLQLSTNTYQAYNEWGGASLYVSAFVGDRAQMVSFDRPTPPDFFEYEYYFVTWLEKFAAEHGLKVDYVTNFDVYRDPGFVEKCRLFISGSHNEYWSKEEFDAVHRRIFEHGKSTMFLGANSAYWQVRYADLNNTGRETARGRHLICYKSVDDPIRDRLEEKDAMQLVTALYRDEARRPETMLCGVAFQSYFEASSDAKYPYKVHTTDLPFFAGTGYRVGDEIGDIVGYEWDNRDPDGDGKRLWDESRSAIAPIDGSSIQVVFTGSPVDLNGKPGTAEAVYFESKAGARVFSTGSIRWAWGFGKLKFAQEKFKLFNQNLILHLLGA